MKKKNKAVPIILIISLAAFFMFVLPNVNSGDGISLEAKAYNSDGDYLGTYKVKNKLFSMMAFTCEGASCDSTMTVSLPEQTDHIKFQFDIVNTGETAFDVYYRPPSEYTEYPMFEPTRVKDGISTLGMNMNYEDKFHDGIWTTFTEPGLNTDFQSHRYYSIMYLVGYQNPFPDKEYIKHVLEIKTGRGLSNYTYIEKGNIQEQDGAVFMYTWRQYDPYWDAQNQFDLPEYWFELIISTYVDRFNPQIHEEGKDLSYARVFDQILWWYYKEPQPYEFKTNVGYSSSQQMSSSFLSEDINIYQDIPNLELGVKGMSGLESKEINYDIGVNLI